MPIFFNFKITRSGAGLRIEGIFVGLDGAVLRAHKLNGDRIAFTANGHRLMLYRDEMPIAVLSEKKFVAAL